jgi:pilus assembly protein CpaB
VSRPTGLSPQRLLLLVSRHRALVAGGLVAAAVATALTAVVPARAPTAQVVASARDLPAGTVLTDADVALVGLPPGTVPDGAARSPDEVVGRHLAGAVRAGEPLTDVRLLGAAIVPAGDDVAVPVRIAEPAVSALVRVGDRVDVLAAPPDGGQVARSVVSDVTVVAVPQLADDLGEGALVVVAASRPAAARLAAAAVTGPLSLVVRGR